jgi:hypothetical protein
MQSLHLDAALTIRRPEIFRAAAVLPTWTALPLASKAAEL